MKRLAGFRHPVVKALAERAGFICSYPGCNATTIGPSNESPLSSAKTGMACHIYAAADGPVARRVNPQKSVDELRSIENGIWMCYKHGKLLDTDECSYAPDLLLDWRRLAERRAELRHKLGREVTPSDLSKEALAKASIRIDTPTLVNDIANAIRLSCLEYIWGKQEALTARDLVIEIARNSLTHGKASQFNLIIDAHTLTFSDDGQAFSHTDLNAADNPRGGVMSWRQFQKRAPNLVISYMREKKSNVFSIASTGAIDELLKTNPCSIAVYGGHESVMTAMDFIEARPECGTIFLYPTFGILAYSDLYNLAAAIRVRRLMDRDITLVMKFHSDGIQEVLASEMPNVKLIEAETD